MVELPRVDELVHMGMKLVVPPDKLLPHDPQRIVLALLVKHWPSDPRAKFANVLVVEA